MENSTYTLTTYWVIAVNITFLIATLWLLKKGKATLVTQSIFASVSMIWILFTHIVFSKKILIPLEISGVAFFIITLSSAALVLTLFYFSALKNVFERVHQEHIQIVQGLRIFVASGFFMEGILNIIPAWFSIMDGFLHVSSGFLALISAIAILKNKRNKNQYLWLANFVGLADIAIIVTSISLVVWNEIGAFHNMQYVVFYTGVLLLWFHFISISKLIKSGN